MEVTRRILTITEVFAMLRSVCSRLREFDSLKAEFCIASLESQLGTAERELAEAKSGWASCNEQQKRIAELEAQLSEARKAAGQHEGTRRVDTCSTRKELMKKKKTLRESHDAFKSSWEKLRAELETQPATKELHQLVAQMDDIAAWEIKP